MSWLLDITLAFATMGLVEALIKPLAKRWAQRRILAAAPMVMDLLDRQLPDLFKQLDGAQLEDVVRHKLESLTGESWAYRDIEPIFKLYDPRITANKLRALQ